MNTKKELNKYRCNFCGKTLYFFEIEKGRVEIKCSRRECGEINILDKRDKSS